MLLISLLRTRFGKGVFEYILGILRLSLVENLYLHLRSSGSLITLTYKRIKTVLDVKGCPPIKYSIKLLCGRGLKSLLITFPADDILVCRKKGYQFKELFRPLGESPLRRQNLGEKL